MLIGDWLAIIFIAVSIVLVALSLSKHRDKHHYDDQESDGSCDPMDDKLDGYDD